ncbi:uncharacterized protein LOC122803267 [Protopterus annectens]|uniref:uncharacterized protein LOC122803267 n=1 Tax=Protopterus annectens TaxID=7888 RepID=UPI001CFBF6C9|nr:uncharacterized protein LOC122803267 [Protopterus annectens]
MASKQPLWVVVKDPVGRAVTSFTVSTDSTVGDLKAALQAAGCTSVTAHDMGLQYSRDQLPDTSTHLDAFHLDTASDAGDRKVKVIQKYRHTASGALEFLIHVRTQSTPVLDLYVTSSDSLGSLKARLTEIIGVPADQLELSGVSGALEGDARSLESLGLEPDSTVSCLLKAGPEDFQVFVYDLQRRCRVIYVHNEELVGSLKRKLSYLLDIPLEGLRVLHQGKQLLDDERTLLEYRVQACSSLQLACKHVQICMDHKLLKTDVPFKSEALDQIASDVSANTGNVACERCILGKNMADWILKDPRTISSDGMSFCISFPGEGRYECSITGLRFQTTAETTITYRYCSWDQYFPDITRRGWSPASSLFDIKVTGAELTAIHIPHFLCIDGQPSENELCFFHMEEEGGNYTVLAPSLVFSKYAVLLKPTFTLIGFVQSILKMFPVHGIVVIFRTHVAKLTLHVYLIPNSRDIEKAVHSHEKERFSVEINKPPQTRPLRIGQKYSLKTKSSSVVRPEVSTDYRIMYWKCCFHMN